MIAITLIYFVMNDKDYPIYDRFAHLALLKIEREDGFDSLITDGELSKAFRNGDNLEDVIKNYEDYKKNGERARTSRGIL